MFCLSCSVLKIQNSKFAFLEVFNTISPPTNIYIPQTNISKTFKDCLIDSDRERVGALDFSGAPNENIVQNHLNIALLNVF